MLLRSAVCRSARGGLRANHPPFSPPLLLLLPSFSYSSYSSFFPSTKNTSSSTVHHHHHHSCTNNSCYRWFSLSSSSDKNGKHAVIMPSIMDAKEGEVVRWLKKEGEHIKPQDMICVIAVADMEVAVDGVEGVLSSILVQPGKKIPTNSAIAEYVDTMDQFIEIREIQREQNQHHEAENRETVKELLDDSKDGKTDIKIILREIRHLIKEGEIQDGSDFAKRIQKLARTGDKDIITLFDSSFEGTNFNIETFDKKFFIDNAKEICDEKAA